MADAASSTVLDFTNVREAGAFNPKRQKAGDYKAKVTGVVDAVSKKDGGAQWLFSIQVNGATYPYYCKHDEASLWKIRNLLVAGGVNVPKKRVKVNPNIVVGKTIAVTLEDDEYEGKLKSVIQATFPVSEMDDDDVPDETEEDVEAEVEDEEEEAPPRRAKKKAAPAVDEDDDDLEEIDIDDT